MTFCSELSPDWLRSSLWTSRFDNAATLTSIRPGVIPAAVVFVQFGSGRRGLLAESLHDAFSVICSTNARHCSLGRNVKNREMEYKSKFGCTAVQVGSCREIRAHHLQTVTAGFITSKHADGPFSIACSMMGIWLW
jgi:hypothetical protein